MGLFDQLSGMLEGGGEGQSSNIVGALLSGGGGAAGGGGIGGVLDQLAANGLSEHIASWTSGGNMPISPQEIEGALGSDQVQQMAQSAGLPVGDFLQHLSQHLPAAAADASGS